MRLLSIYRIAAARHISIARASPPPRLPPPRLFSPRIANRTAVNMSQPKRETKQVTKSSTCNCGRVSVRVQGGDKGAVLCHCANCQKASGSAFMYNLQLKPAKLEVVKGQDVLKSYEDGNTKSGNRLRRWFCGECGCPLYLTNPAYKDLIVMHGGGVDAADSTEGSHPQPRMELFPENKHEWTGNMTTKAKM